MSNNKKISKVPDSISSSMKINKWADYIEIRCLKSLDKDFTADELYDQMYGDKSEDEINDSNSAQDIGESEKNDKREAIINDRFNFIESRIHLFQDFYPFSYDRRLKQVKLKNRLSFKHYSYISLLLASNLDYFREHMPDLTKKFEIISFYAFQKCFPAQANVHYFGKGGEKEGIFEGVNKLYDRIKLLGEKLNISLSSTCTEENIGHTNTGDGGLDLVGWYDFKDDIAGDFMIFAQCACGKEWFPKQFEAHHVTWDSYFQFLNKPTNMLFTPSSFRDASGDWLNSNKIRQTIIVDRARILKLLVKKENSKNAISHDSIIKQVMKDKIVYPD